MHVSCRGKGVWVIIWLFMIAFICSFVDSGSFLILLHMVWNKGVDLDYPVACYITLLTMKLIASTHLECSQTAGSSLLLGCLTKLLESQSKTLTPATGRLLFLMDLGCLGGGFGPSLVNSTSNLKCFDRNRYAFISLRKVFGIFFV